MTRVTVIGPLADKMTLKSYGAYLSNNLLLPFFVQYSVRGPWWAGTLIFIPGSFGLGAISYYLVEKT